MRKRATGQQGAAPAAGAERADRGQRQEGGAQRDDRAVGGEVVGGAAGRRGHQDAVADQLGQAEDVVDVDASGAAWRVSRKIETSLMPMASTVLPSRRQARMRKRVEVTRWARPIRSGDVGEVVAVEQEADRAEVHAVDRLGQRPDGRAASPA